MLTLGKGVYEVSPSGLLFFRFIFQSKSFQTRVAIRWPSFSLVLTGPDFHLVRLFAGPLAQGVLDPRNFVTS